MSAPRVVTIDGAAGSGKSTLAKALARALDLPYVNTGLMYRALTRAALDRGVDLDDGDALADLTRGLRFRLSDADPPQLAVEGSTPAALTTDEVDAAVSRASRHPAVRALMHAAQRELGRAGAVMEGRDIGTVVFPDAPVKLFLRADAAERGARRAEERDGATPEVSSALRARDARDARVAPHVPAPGALTLDTTEATPERTLDLALTIVRERLP
jgi:cytidylate kinase